MKIVLIILGIICAVCAFAVYCCCVMGGREDDRMEKYRRRMDDGEGKDA